MGAKSIWHKTVAPVAFVAVAGAGVLAFSGCASEPVGERTVVVYGNHRHVHTVQIEFPTDAIYNPQTRNWERPYPYGPDARYSPGR